MLTAGSRIPAFLISAFLISTFMGPSPPRPGSMPDLFFDVHHTTLARRGATPFTFRTAATARHKGNAAAHGGIRMRQENWTRRGLGQAAMAAALVGSRGARAAVQRPFRYA